MPKKSGRSRIKHNRQAVRHAAAARGTSPPAQVLPLTPRQTTASKSTTAAAELATKYQYAVWDIKRSLIIGSAVLAILFILYFFLR